MAIDKIKFKIDDFSGGLNERDANHKVLNNECVQDTQNVSLSHRGALSKRTGFGKYKAYPVVDGSNVTGMFEGLIAKQVFWSLWGKDRYQTASQTARKLWATNEYAVIANGEAGTDYSDAAVGNLLAGALRCPLLLTQTNSLPQDTLSALRDLKVQTIYIIGGTLAVSQDVEDLLTEDPEGFTVTRIFGASREATARAVAAVVNAIPDNAVGEEQVLNFGGYGEGTYTLSDGVSTTAPLDPIADPSTVEAALEVIYGAGNVTVVDTAPLGSLEITITFDDTIGDSGLAADFSGLSGPLGAPPPTLTITQPYLPPTGIASTCYFVGTGAPSDSVVVGPAVASGINNEARALFFTGATLSVDNSNAITAYGITDAVIVGGTGRVAQQVEDDLVTLLGAGHVSRISGANRYYTAINFADDLKTNHGFDNTVVSNGADANCIDGIAAAVLAARTGSAIVLVAKDAIYTYVDTFLDTHVTPGDKLFALGGPDALGADVWARLEEKTTALAPEEYLLASAGTTLSYWDAALSLWQPLKQDLTPAYPVEFLQYKHSIYIVNGVDGYFSLEEDLLTATMMVKEVRPYSPTAEEIESLGPNVIPKNPKFIAMHYDRVWVARIENGRLRVFMSDLGVAGDALESPFKMFRPDYFPANNYLDTYCKKGDEVTAFTIFQDRPHIFTQHSIWTVYGANPAEYQLVKVGDNIGCVSHRSIAEAREGLLFYSQDGPVLFNGTSSFDLCEKIPDTIAAVDKDEWDSIAGEVFDNHYYLTLPFAAETIIMTLDLRGDLYNAEGRKVWLPLRTSGIIPLCWLTTKAGELVFGSADGHLYSLSSTAYLDVAAAIASEYTTKAFGEKYTYRFRRFRIRLKQYTGNLTFKYRVDLGAWVSTVINMANVPLNQGQSVYRDVYGNAIGDTVQIMLEHSANGNFEIESIEVQAYARKVRT